MRSGGKSVKRQPTGHRSGVVLLAMFALLLQLMIPSAVMAAQTAASGGMMVICTGDGVETFRAPDSSPPAKGFAGLPCQDCLAPASAALPAPLLEILPVAYATARVVHTETVRPWAAPARAPPRPPGQAPPASNV